MGPAGISEPTFHIMSFDSFKTFDAVPWARSIALPVSDSGSLTSVGAPPMAPTSGGQNHRSSPLRKYALAPLSIKSCVRSKAIAPLDNWAGPTPAGLSPAYWHLPVCVLSNGFELVQVIQVLPYPVTFQTVPESEEVRSPSGVLKALLVPDTLIELNELNCNEVTVDSLASH